MRTAEDVCLDRGIDEEAMRCEARAGRRAKEAARTTRNVRTDNAKAGETSPSTHDYKW